MTGLGMIDVQTARMDLIELARTYQQDRQRMIEQETRRRRLVAAIPSIGPRRHLPPAQPTGQSRPGQTVSSAPTAR